MVTKDTKRSIMSTSDRQGVDIMRVCGIYRITVSRGELTPKFYIGQSVNLTERRSTHIRELRSGVSKNPAMQKAFVKYGETAFSFETLEVCPEDRNELARREKVAIDEHIATHGRRNLFNVLVNETTSRLGVPHSEETRARMRAAQTKPRSAKQLEWTADFVKINVGRRLTPEAIAKRTAKQKGIVRSLETRLLMSEAARNRPPMSEEVRRKISETKKAKGQCPTPEQIEKARLGNIGRRPSDNAIAAATAAKLGKRKPAEEIARRQATRAENAAKVGRAY